MLRSVYGLLTFALIVGCDNEEAAPGYVPPQGDPVVRITQFEIGADLSEPFFLNHRIPVTFEVVNPGVPAGDEPEPVAITFSFVVPDGSDDPDGCSSNAIVVNPPADGTPQTVKGFIWPTSECESLAGDGREFALDVEFFREDAVAGAVEVDLPMLQLASGGIDIDYLLKPTSSVALLPRVEANESQTPVLVVQSSLVYNGRNPYVARVSPDEVPADLRAAEPDIDDALRFDLNDAELEAVDALPSGATIRYTLAPASDPDDTLPLTIGQSDGTTQNTAVVERVDPGIAMGIAHELHLEGDALAAVSAGGRLADETAFVLTGCMAAEFEQSFGDAEDCKTVEIELVRQTAEASGASELTFNRRFERSLGNGRISVSAVMETNNRLSRSGAFSRTEGRIDLNGRLGRSFSVAMAGAHAEAELTNEQAAFDAAVVAFNQTVFSTSDTSEEGLENTEEFSVDRSFRVGSLGFGVGPVRLGFTIDVGGRVGLVLDDELNSIADSADCQTRLATDAAMLGCGRVARSVTPAFSLTARIFGGLDRRLIRAGVEANLRLVETRFPLTTELVFGLSDDGRLLVRGDVDWDMTLQLINGRAQLVASFKRRRRRRRRRSRSWRVNLFSFQSQVHQFDLIERTMINPLELL